MAPIPKDMVAEVRKTLDDLYAAQKEYIKAVDTASAFLEAMISVLGNEEYEKIK